MPTIRITDPLKTIAWLTGLIVLLGAGCARTLPPPMVVPSTVTRVAAEPPAVGQAAERLVDDCLSRPWADAFFARSNRRPVVQVKHLRNEAVPFSAAETLKEQLEQALVRSGRVDVAGSSGVASGELDDQRAHASDETLKQHKPLPSDYVLSGTLSARGVATVAYLHLIDARTNEKVWIAIRSL